ELWLELPTSSMILTTAILLLSVGDGCSLFAAVRQRGFSGGAQRAQLRPGPGGVAAQEPPTRRPRGEGERLGGVVEGERATTQARGDHLPAAGGVQLVGLAAEAAGGGVAAGVTKPDLGTQLRGDARRAGAQAQVHVLEEQERRLVERAQCPQRVGAGDQAGGDR